MAVVVEALPLTLLLLDAFTITGRNSECGGRVRGTGGTIARDLGDSAFGHFAPGRCYTSRDYGTRVRGPGRDTCFEGRGRVIGSKAITLTGSPGTGGLISKCRRQPGCGLSPGSTTLRHTGNCVSSDCGVARNVSDGCRSYRKKGIYDIGPAALDYRAPAGGALDYCRRPMTGVRLSRIVCSYPSK